MTTKQTCTKGLMDNWNEVKVVVFSLQLLNRFGSLNRKIKFAHRKYHTALLSTNMIWCVCAWVRECACVHVFECVVCVWFSVYFSALPTAHRCLVVYTCTDTHTHLHTHSAWLSPVFIRSFRGMNQTVTHTHKNTNNILHHLKCIVSLQK